MGSSLETIKEAIGGLPEDDRVALAAWLSLREMDDWDREMHRDFSTGGRGCALVDRVRAEVLRGEFESMPAPGGSADARH